MCVAAGAGEKVAATSWEPLEMVLTLFDELRRIAPAQPRRSAPRHLFAQVDGGTASAGA